MPARFSPGEMSALKRRAAAFASLRPLSPFRRVMQDFYSQEGIEFAQSWMSNAIKKHHKKSFEQMQREARLDFIKENAHESNAWLAGKLGISQGRVGDLLVVLKKEGKVRASKRYSESKAAVREAIPLAYSNSAHSIARLLTCAELTKGVSINDLIHVLKMPRQTAEQNVGSLRGLGFLRVVRVEARRKYLALTPNGIQWLRDMDEIRRERDKALVKTGSIGSVIKGKESEKERLRWAIQFVESKGTHIDRTTIERTLNELQKEIIELRTIMLRRQMS